MFNKIKSSLVAQNNFLFFISIFFISQIWLAFFLLQKHQIQEHSLERYINAFNYLKPLLKNDIQIPKEILESFHFSIFEGTILKNDEVIFKKGSSKEGLKYIEFQNKKILHLYTFDEEIFLIDLHTDENMNFIHGLFIFLFITQIVLHLKVNSFLYPLRKISTKLKKLEYGDRSPLDIDSRFDEINLITNSYNDSIEKIDYMLETREMFNKIFMHEMKMPLAKGMFYLKQEPSQKTHEKLQNILTSINEELEEFTQIENLLTYQNNLDTSEHDFLDILNIAIKRVGIAIENIQIQCCLEDVILKGDKDFWVLCIKNIIDNGVKYSYNKKITIGFDEGIYFKNYGDPLPVDISQETSNWKIDKNKRHKSSTGYGFGLFIIKNITIFHKYSLGYVYDKEKKEVILKIF